MLVTPKFLEHGVACIYFVISVIAVINIHPKVCCVKRDEFGDKIYDLVRSQKIAICCFYWSNILWQLSYALTIGVIPISRQLAVTVSPSLLCAPTILFYRTCSALYLFSLTNILTERLSLAFEDTEFALSRRSAYGIRITVVLVWATVSIPSITHYGFPEPEGTECLKEMKSGQQLAIAGYIVLMALENLLLWVLFMWKMIRFRQKLKRFGSSNGESDFLLDLMKKHSIIFFWVTAITVVLSVLQFVGASVFGRAPIICDMAVNVVAISLQFAANDRGYRRCGCNFCVNWCCDCECWNQEGHKEAEIVSETNIDRQRRSTATDHRTNAMHSVLDLTAGNTTERRESNGVQQHSNNGLKGEGSTERSGGSELEMARSRPAAISVDIQMTIEMETSEQNLPGTVDSKENGLKESSLGSRMFECSYEWSTRL